MQNLLVTGAGGAAAIAFLNAVRRPSIAIHAADRDPNAAGLFLVPRPQRHLILSAKDPGFVDDLLDRCRRFAISILVPTVDAEMLPLALRRSEFEDHGVKLLMASTESLMYCLDKAALLDRCRPTVPCPVSLVLAPGTDVEAFPLPAIVKPRRGSGSRGVMRIETRSQLSQLPCDGSLLLQQELPGEEYSVDVLASPTGQPLAAVTRNRLKVDSGVAVTAVTQHDPELEALSAAAVRRTGLSFVANVQWKRDSVGVPRLLEINPRFPGTMPLTIASGIDMPNLSLRLLRGETISQSELRFTPRAMVRTWQEHFVEPSELRDMADLQRNGACTLEACA